MKNEPANREKLIDLLLAKTRAIRYITLFLAIIFVINTIAPNRLKTPLANNSRLTSTIRPAKENSEPKAEMPGELIAAEGYESVLKHCGNCHSLKLVTQNRANREGWKNIIEWMQETQNLWDLGEDEDAILDYLAKNYAPQKKGRRQNLANIKWYELEN